MSQINTQTTTKTGPTQLQIKNLTSTGPKQQQQSAPLTKKLSLATVSSKYTGNSKNSDVQNSSTLPANLAMLNNNNDKIVSASSSAVQSVEIKADDGLLANALSEKKANLFIVNSNRSGGDDSDELKTVQGKDSGEEEDDPSSPFKRNTVNTVSGGSLAASSNEFSNLNDIDAKTVKKAKSKNLLKRLFCCFSPSNTNSQRNYKTSDKNGGSALTAAHTSTTSRNALVPHHNQHHNHHHHHHLHPHHADTSSPVKKENKIINIEKDEQKVAADANNNAHIHFNSNANNSHNHPAHKHESINNSTNNNASILNAAAGNNLSARLINITINNQPSNTINTNSNLNNHLYQNESFIPQNIPEKYLLPPVRPSDMGRKCLIIDLDETLVHSSFKHVHNADFIVPVEIDGTTHQVFVLKRPHVDEFLRRMGELYECILFTASLAKYADPVSDLLDKWNVFRGRLFREACVFYRGNYVKDLSRLGRDLNKVIILDNSPASYIFHPDNAVPCTSWFDDMHDTELLDLIPHFERLAHVDSVYSVLRTSSGSSGNNSSVHNYYSPPPPLHQPNYQHDYSDNSSGSHNQQVPSSTPQSIIYQAPQQQPTTTNTNVDPNFKYYNENKVLLSIDLMMANKQQQQQQQQQQH